MTRNLNPKEFSCLNAKLYAFQREFFDSKPEPYFTQVAKLPKGDIAYTLLSQDGQSSVSIQKDGISVKHGNTMKAYLVQLPREAPLYNLFHSLKYYTYENLPEALLEILQNRYMDRSAYAKFPLGSKNSVIMLNGVAYTIMDNELDENKTKVITLDRKSVSDRELEIIVPGGCLFFSWELTTNRAGKSTIIYPRDKYYLPSPVILDGGTPALLKFKFASLDAQTIELKEFHTYYADKDKEIKQLVRTIKLKVT